MMADTDEKINKCIEKSLNYLSAIGRPIVLKCEQRISIQHLLLGKDVILILPTGFGKRLYLPCMLWRRFRESCFARHDRKTQNNY